MQETLIGNYHPIPYSHTQLSGSELRCFPQKLKILDETSELGIAYTEFSSYLVLLHQQEHVSSHSLCGLKTGEANSDFTLAGMGFLFIIMKHINIYYTY